MNIVVDSGNTITKVGIFKDDILEKESFFQDSSALQAYLEMTPAENIIVSSVSSPADVVLSWSVATGLKIVLSADTSLPINILYKTPATLGVDRIAAVCGALVLCPGQNCLIVDAGTCMTFEFLDAEGSYHGGAISPGLNMRLEAMHQFTARLPLVRPQQDIELIGKSTEQCMQSGAVNGIRAEVVGIIERYRTSWPQLRVLVCGGDAHYFDLASGVDAFIAPNLVLVGLNKILVHLAATKRN